MIYTHPFNRDTKYAPVELFGISELVTICNRYELKRFDVTEIRFGNIRSNKHIKTTLNDLAAVSANKRNNLRDVPEANFGNISVDFDGIRFTAAARSRRRSRYGCCRA